MVAREKISTKRKELLAIAQARYDLELRNGVPAYFSDIERELSQLDEYEPAPQAAKPPRRRLRNILFG